MISIVIPVYNASTDLRRCLDSILRQTAIYEVWLINDGSTDESGLICDEYVQNYAQFHVYHGENNGVSHARNIGIEKAIGNYITFIDADDYIEDNFLEEIYPINEEDFTICGRKVEYSNGRIDDIIPNFTNMNNILSSSLIRSVWGKLFKVGIIRSQALLFDTSLAIGEDTLFVLTYLNHIGTYKVIANSGYVYRCPSYSINKYRSLPSHLIDLRRKLLKQELLLKNKSYDTVQLSSNNNKIIGFNLLSLLYLSNRYYSKERLEYLDEFFQISNKEDIGLSNFLAKVYKILLKLGNPALLDIFLLSAMKIIWWKSKVYKY